MDVSDWLRKLGLERYEAAFRDNEIDWDALPKLTAEDFKDLGVVLGGHRRKLLKAIATLREGRAPVAPVAERRQLTVMFCDLVGSTKLAARLDPEDLREVIAVYHRAVDEIVAGLEGFVAKYMGDGVLVYFGYTRAHENDAEHAVRAGLGVIDAVARLDIRSVTLQARVGQSSAKRRTLPPVCKLWQNRTRSSSLRARAGWLVIFSNIAISAPLRSRASPSRCRPGRCCVLAPSRAGSRRCVGPP
jgi:hypothetical protein